MMHVFGGYEAYKNAPARVVEEQILLWVAEKQAEGERAKEDERKMRQQQ